MGTAVITRSPQTQILAGRSRYTVSGMDSFKSSGTPSDAWKEIRSWEWSLSDGSTADGGVVALFLVLPATYTVNLLVTFRDGTTASASTTIVAETANVVWRRHVSAAGLDSNDGLTPATAWLTPQKAFDAWALERGPATTTYRGARNSWGEILFRFGDALPHNNGSTIDFGPVLLGVYGGSAHATITNNQAGDDGIQLSRSAHDNTLSGDPYFNPNAYDNAVYWDSINVAYASQKWYTGLLHHNTQFTNGTIAGSGVNMSGGQPGALVLYNAEVFGGGRNGAFFSGAFSMIEGCYIHDTGTLVNFDNCIYQSAGALHSSVRSTRLKQGTNPISVFGYDCSGGSKIYSCDVWSDGCRGNFSFPGNPSPDEPGFDFVFERMLSTNAVGEAFGGQYGGRWSLRNSFSISDFYGVLIGCSHVGDSGTHTYIHDWEVVDCSFSQLRGAGVFVSSGSSGNFNGITINGVAWRQLAAGGTGTLDHALWQIDSVDLPFVSVNKNQYFREGDSAGSGTFAFVDGAMRSFTYWTGTLLQDVDSGYGDPLYVNPNSNLHLQAGSPCIDHGPAGGLGRDYDGTPRPQGPDEDIGAFEHFDPGGFDGEPASATLAPLGALGPGGSLVFSSATAAGVVGPLEAFGMFVGPELETIIVPPAPAALKGDDLVTRVARAIADFFPPGPLYKPALDGTLQDLRLAIADESALLRERAQYLIDVELDPARTLELLPDFERWYGLPDRGLAALGPQTVAQRRAAVLARIRAVGGQSPTYYIAVALTLGYQIEIEEFDRSKVGRKVGSPIYSGDWEFVWKVHAPYSTIHHARAGASFAGDRVGTFGNAPLEVFLREIQPAHTVLLFAYDLGGPPIVRPGVVLGAPLARIVDGFANRWWPGSAAFGASAAVGAGDMLAGRPSDAVDSDWRTLDWLP